MNQLNTDTYNFKPNERFAFIYNKGRFSVELNGIPVFADASSEFKLGDRIVSSTEYTEQLLTDENVSDERGNGVKITASLKCGCLPEMRQHFTFYENPDYFLISTELFAEDGKTATNYIAPLIVRNTSFLDGEPKWTNFLEVPFDNDAWVSFKTRRICENGLSHEVGAFFIPDSGSGMIIGSLTHDTWKSAVEYTAQPGGLYVYSGANTKLTRDQSPHGTVSGKRVSSAVFFVGFYDNWKHGMNEYAKINTTFVPKRKAVIDTTPLGWNSWGSIQSDINYSKAIKTSDYIKEHLQKTWQENNETVYVNLDSYWDNMSHQELCDFVKHCEANGQIAGIYLSPFVSWWDEEGMKNNRVPGTDVTYNDIRLKKADGSFYGNDIDGCYPLDVSHPAAVIHFKTKLKKLMSCGFKYIKLDFLVHGSLEGIHYRDDIQTGIQAYNYAMNEICSIVGDDVFINLSMAPTFPYNHANGRRISCDAFYSIGNTEYVLNSLTYGFWQKELYDYIDPDHIVLWGKDGAAGEDEARSRLVSGIITGGSFLAGDDFISPVGDRTAAFARYEKLLANKKLIDIVKFGETFEARLTADCEYAAEIFTLEKEDRTYIAALNYRDTAKTHIITFPSDNYTAVNLFTGEENICSGKLEITLNAKDSVIYEISKKVPQI